MNHARCTGGIARRPELSEHRKEAGGDALRRTTGPDEAKPCGPYKDFDLCS